MAAFSLLADNSNFQLCFFLFRETTAAAGVRAVNSGETAARDGETAERYEEIAAKDGGIATIR